MSNSYSRNAAVLTERLSVSSDTDKIMSVGNFNLLAERARSLANGAGSLGLQVDSYWNANTRWARNEIISSGDRRNNMIHLRRNIKGAGFGLSISNHSDSVLRRAIEWCERYLQLGAESSIQPEFPRLQREVVPIPQIWHLSTLNLEEEVRAQIFGSLTSEAEREGMFSAGYIEVSAHGRAFESEGEPIHHRSTDAQLSITVRDPKGRGSGWAGLTWDNWDRINGQDIANKALDKCLKSINPVAIEPGRYTVVLEPQAVHDLVSPLFSAGIIFRPEVEHPRRGNFYTLRPGYSKIGLRLFDQRLMVHTDPYHPDCYYYPYGTRGAYKKATWVDEGVLVNLSYDRDYAISKLGINESLLGSGSYIMEGAGSGTNVDLETMISNTERGLLVTRFHIDMGGIIDGYSMLTTGLTRDGLWLIEHGKISKAVKNLRFTESPVFMLNNVLEFGVPTRVFSPGRPCLVPAIRARDFSFTATIDAI